MPLYLQKEDGSEISEREGCDLIAGVSENLDRGIVLSGRANNKTIYIEDTHIHFFPAIISFVSKHGYKKVHII